MDVCAWLLQSFPILCDPMDCSPPDSSAQGILHALFQGIFPTQGSNLHLLHCRQILYLLSHCGSPQSHIEIHRKGLGLPPRQAWEPLQMEPAPHNVLSSPKWPMSQEPFQQTCCYLISALLGESNIPMTSKSSLFLRRFSTVIWR